MVQGFQWRLQRTWNSQFNNNRWKIAVQRLVVRDSSDVDAHMVSRVTWSMDAGSKGSASCALQVPRSRSRDERNGHRRSAMPTKERWSKSGQEQGVGLLPRVQRRHSACVTAEDNWQGKRGYGRREFWQKSGQEDWLMERDDCHAGSRVRERRALQTCEAQCISASIGTKRRWGQCRWPRRREVWICSVVVLYRGLAQR